ncbi:MAG: hypothetical protein ACKOC5_01090, partial [Chloroflexota bacterium]
THQMLPGETIQMLNMLHRWLVEEPLPGFPPWILYSPPNGGGPGGGNGGYGGGPNGGSGAHGGGPDGGSGVNDGGGDLQPQAGVRTGGES